MVESIAQKIFDGYKTEVQLEDNLWNINVPFENIEFDEYDRSIEINDVDNNYRLSSEAQKLLFDAGFSKVYMNHKDKWETHYSFASGLFKEVEGWRVSYPSKRGKNEKSIWVEKKVDSWPVKWFETEYAIIKGND